MALFDESAPTCHVQREQALLGEARRRQDVREQEPDTTAAGQYAVEVAELFVESLLTPDEHGGGRRLERGCEARLASTSRFDRPRETRDVAVAALRVVPERVLRVAVDVERVTRSPVLRHVAEQRPDVLRSP